MQGSNKSTSRLSSASRRRVIRIVAAATGLGLVGATAGLARLAKEPDTRLRRWRGTALGADATLLIDHPDGARAERLLAVARAEIERLERIFSLYRPDSALVRLNAEGRLRNPPAELVVLLDRARQWGALSDGAFDVTVQPLWQLYRDHFSRPGADPRGPDEAAVRTAQALVDFNAVEISANEISFARPGMAVTLNGIAQGEITDRVADLLRAEGLEHALIELGEFRALSSHPSGRPWQVGVRDPHQADAVVAKLPLMDRALATSATTGTQFDPLGRHHHLFDPGAGRPSRGLVSASVIARRARDADAFSTALLASPEPLAPAAVSHLGIESVLTVSSEGQLGEWRMAT